MYRKGPSSASSGRETSEPLAFAHQCAAGFCYARAVILRRLGLWGAAALIAAAIGVAAPVRAQAPEVSPEDRAAARAEYQRAMQAVRAERWDEAVQAFERAYEIAPMPLILFNLAGAQMESGRLVDAARTYQRFLAEAAPTSDAGEFRSEAQTALERLRQTTPRVVINVASRAETDDVRLDGDALEPSQIGEEIPVDPGPHEAELVRGGDVVASHRFELDEGDLRTILLRAGESIGAPSAAFSSDTTAEVDEGGGFPWVWVAVGAVVVGGAVAATILLTSGGSAPDPYTGNLAPGGFVL